MQARRLLASLFAAATISSGCSVLAGPSAAPVQPPRVDQTVNVDPEFPNDGLTRLIVTPIESTPLDATAADGAAADAAPDEPVDEAGDSDDTDADPVPTAGAAPVVADPSRVLTPEMLAAMPPGAILEARDGKVGYLDVDGTFVSFDPVEVVPPTTMVEGDEEPEEEPEPEPEIEVAPLYGNPYIDELAMNPAVENIIVVGDGTFGIDIRDPTVIDPELFSVEVDVPFGIAGDPSEQFQWHLENNGTNLQAVTGESQVEDADLDVDLTVGVADGNGIVIAVIDSGVDFSHPDLANSSWSNLGETCDNGVDDDGNGYVDDCYGWDFANSDNEPFNPGANVHGTHVAGIITADRNGIGGAGIAPAARIMDLNVAYPNGTTSGAGLTSAIRYAVDNGADIINLSIASKVGVDPKNVRGLRAAIDYAGLNGVLVVAAAGNHNVDIGSLAVYPASFSRANMLVVGASAANDTQAEYSNYSATLVDLYAPGHQIMSTAPGNDYVFRSGSSMAAPAVAAVAALVMETSPDADYELVVEQILSTVDPVATLPASVSGGRVNAASALGLSDAPAIPSELEVSVVGLASTGNEVAAEIVIATPPKVFDEEYRWELSLISATHVSDYAVVEHPFMIAGVETATGLTGAVVLGSSAITSVAVSTELPDGRYSFVIEAVPVADGNSRLGDVFVTSFEVGNGLPAPGETTTTTTVPETTTTTAPPTTEAPSTEPGAEPSDESVAPETTVATTVTTVPTTPVETVSPEPTAASVDPGTPVTTAPITTIATTTTAAPQEAAAGESAPPVTAPPATPPSTVPSEPPPVPPDIGPETAEDGDWAITSITPRAGYIDNANTVTIRGSFPIATYVWFDGQPGQVVYQSGDLITVRTPKRATVGNAEVTLRVTGMGTLLTLPDAYGFAEWSVDEPEEDIAIVDESAGDLGAEGVGLDGLSADETEADGATPLSFRRSRMVIGTAVDIGNGMRGAAFSPNPTADTETCTVEPCVAVRR